MDHFFRSSNLNFFKVIKFKMQISHNLGILKLSQNQFYEFKLILSLDLNIHDLFHLIAIHHAKYVIISYHLYAVMVV